MFWLLEWRKQGGTVPKEFTVVMSLALLNAAARALANFSSLDAYMETLFQIVQNPESPPVAPSTFIRIDIAHLIKNVVDSDAFCDVRPKVKDFFVRCVALLIKKTDFVKARQHIQDVLFVALSTNEGKYALLHVSKRFH